MDAVKPSDEPVIRLEHVEAGYPGRTILRDVTFDVRRGEIFVLLGGSGCGKSTILKHMIGLNPVLGGRLTLAGQEWTRKTRASLCRKIGVMYQSGALFGSMTCLENVLLPLEEFSRLGRTARRARALELLDNALGPYESISQVIETEAVGFSGPAFLNCAVRYRTRKRPLTVLGICKDIEYAMGRRETMEFAPHGSRIFHDRIIDIDTARCSTRRAGG